MSSKRLSALLCNGTRLDNVYLINFATIYIFRYKLLNDLMERYLSWNSVYN